MRRITALGTGFAHRTRKQHFFAFLGGLAVAGTIVVMTAAIADGPDEPPVGQEASPPAGTLKPGESSLPDGAKVLTAPGAGESLTIGRMRILPVGGVPSYDWAADARVKDLVRAYDVDKDADLSLGRERGLAIVRPPLPKGFVLEAGGVDTYRSADGAEFPARGYYRFTAPDQFPIELQTVLLRPGGIVDVVSFADETGHDLATFTVDETPVVISVAGEDSTIQAYSEATFVIGDWEVRMEAHGLPAAITLDFLTAGYGSTGRVTCPRRALAVRDEGVRQGRSRGRDRCGRVWAGGCRPRRSQPAVS